MTQKTDKNIRFKILFGENFIKSGYEVTPSYNDSKEYRHKCSCKRYISYIKTLKPFACKENPKNCKYYKSCMQKQTSPAKCGIEEIQTHINDLVIGKYSLELVRTEKIA